MPSTMEDAFRKAGLAPKATAPEPRTQPPPPRPGSGMPGRPPQAAAPAVTLGDGYVEQAERVIMDYNSSNRDAGKFTTSKIRNILSMVSEIYNDVLMKDDPVLDQETQERIQYMKVRLVYESGREPYIIKPFVEKAQLREIIAGIGSDKKKFMRFAHYMEALVAYHRFHGGSDK